LIHADDLEIDVVIRLSVNKAVAATSKAQGSGNETGKGGGMFTFGRI
jgi:hypothetical protein